MVWHYLLSTTNLEVSRSHQLPYSRSTNVHNQRLKNTQKVSERTAKRPPKYLQNALLVRHPTGWKCCMLHATCIHHIQTANWCVTSVCCGYCCSFEKGADPWLSIPHNGKNFKTTCWTAGKHKWMGIFIPTVVCPPPVSYPLPKRVPIIINFIKKLGEQRI